MESNWEKKAESKAENRGEESHASQNRKTSREKKRGRAQAKAQYSPFRLERVKNRLAEQKPYKAFRSVKADGHSGRNQRKAIVQVALPQKGNKGGIVSLSTCQHRYV